MNDTEEIGAEFVEVCPQCDHENYYSNYNVEQNGYVVKCQHCGKEILLCDACNHNQNGTDICNWHYISCDGKTVKTGCFRGVCTNPADQFDIEYWKRLQEVANG